MPAGARLLVPREALPGRGPEEFVWRCTLVCGPLTFAAELSLDLRVLESPVHTLSGLRSSVLRY